MSTSSHPGRARWVALALAAVLVTFAGSATAGALVTGKQIKNGTVTGLDLRDTSVTGADVEDDSLTADDFSGAIQGPPGPAGPRGPQGPIGAPRVHGASGLEYVVVAQSIPPEATRTWAAMCAPATSCPSVAASPTRIRPSASCWRPHPSTSSVAGS